jgi:hypothetical protein
MMLLSTTDWCLLNFSSHDAIGMGCAPEDVRSSLAYLVLLA